jgi:hypothetical protein
MVKEYTERLYYPPADEKETEPAMPEYLEKAELE